MPAKAPARAEIEGDEHSGLRPAKSFAGAAWAVAVADVVDEPRQCAGGRRRGARASRAS